MPFVDPSTFLTSGVLHNGVGRFVCQLQRVTLRFCKEWGDSKGMREFIEHDLLDFARRNPGIVVYVQPRRHQRPQLHAEYLNGRAETMDASTYKREAIIKFLDQFRCQSGVEIMRIRKDQRTDSLSVQGPWNPFLTQPTDWNLRKFPDEELSRALKVHKSATDIVLELAREQGIVNVVEGKEEKSDSSRNFEEREDDQIIRPVTAKGSLV